MGPFVNDDYLPAFEQENVEVVDVSGGIERITPRGMAVNGVEHELDCIVFSTGFELGATWAHQAGYDIIGRFDMWEKWREAGDFAGLSVA